MPAAHVQMARLVETFRVLHDGRAHLGAWVFVQGPGLQAGRHAFEHEWRPGDVGGLHREGMISGGGAEDQNEWDCEEELLGHRISIHAAPGQRNR